VDGDLGTTEWEWDVSLCEVRDGLVIGEDLFAVSGGVDGVCDD